MYRITPSVLYLVNYPKQFDYALMTLAFMAPSQPISLSSMASEPTDVFDIYCFGVGLRENHLSLLSWFIMVMAVAWFLAIELVGNGLEGEIMTLEFSPEQLYCFFLRP